MPQRAREGDGVAEAGPHHEWRGARAAVDVGEACAAAVKLVVRIEGDGK